MSTSEDESVDDFLYSDCPSDLDDPYRFLLNKWNPNIFYVTIDIILYALVHLPQILILMMKVRWVAF